MKRKTKQFFETSVNIYGFTRRSILDFSTVLVSGSGVYEIVYGELLKRNETCKFKNDFP
jgi:hypothetical protein